jgi:hypothetical protein
MKPLKNWLLLVLVTLFSLLSTPASAEENCGLGEPPAVAELQTVLNTTSAKPGVDLKPFTTLAGTPEYAKAPKTVTVPPELTKGAQGAWDDSLPGGKSQEQGGILVRNADGTYEWKRGKPGKAGSWSQNYGDVDKDETLVALLHTHPYDATEGGYTDVPFSGQDLALLVIKDEPITTVQSGKGFFVAAKSKEFLDRVAKLDAAGQRKLFDEMKVTWDNAFNTALSNGKSFSEAALLAGREVANKYKLLLYAGEAGKPLTLVN